ncbi:MAG: InlB B-repeat-containing protein, partial [Clostridia bacterium]|nr:InlB B-repeat-containing protein [Clostridia bacterium]
RYGNLMWEIDTTALQGRNLYQFPGEFDYDSFGATFVIGEPPEEPVGGTFEVKFYGADNSTVVWSKADAASPFNLPSGIEVEAPEGKYLSAWAKEQDGETVSFPCVLDGDTEFYPVFEDLPSYENPLDDSTTYPGNRGPLKTADQLTQAHGDNWIYTATEAFEIPGAEKIEDISSDSLNNLEPTDGYVQPGDFVFLKVYYAINGTYEDAEHEEADLYLGLASFAIFFSEDFFDTVKYNNQNVSARPLSRNAFGSNTDLETYGGIMNADNPIVKGGAKSYLKLTNGSANTAKVKNNSGYKDTNELLNVGLTTTQGAREGDLFYKNDIDTWVFGLLYQVKKDTEATPMPEGKTGGIYLPITSDPNTKSYFQVPHMNEDVGKKRYGNLMWEIDTTALQGRNLYQFPGEFDYDSFGATFVIGEAPEGPVSGETFTASFYGADGELVDTITDIAPGAQINAIEAPVVEGMNFRGWSTVEGDESAIVTFPQTIVENTEFYAIYTDENPFVINLSTGETITGYEGDTIDLPDGPKETGKTYVGWAADPEASPDDAVKQFVIPGNDDETTLYPIYTVNTYVVTFNPNKGEGGGSAEAVEYGTPIADVIREYEIEASRTGYELAGWSRRSDATQPDADLGTVTGRTTVYAVWTVKVFNVYLYISKDATEPYYMGTITYDSYLSLSSGEKPSAQEGAPAGSKFDGWVTESDSPIAASETRFPDRGAYTTEADIVAYATWIESSTMTFYIPSGETEGEWVRVGQYTTANWNNIKNDTIAKVSEQGYEYDFNDRVYAPKWYTDEAGTEGVVTLDGKDSDNNTVTIVSDPITSVHYYLNGSRISRISVVTEDGTVLYEPTGTNHEGDSIVISRKALKDAAPAGMEFAGYFVDENGERIEPGLSGTEESGYASFEAPYGEHTYTPEYKKTVYTLVFRVDQTDIATATLEYGDTFSLATSETEGYGGYTGFPTIPENIPDIEADPSKSTELYPYTLENWAKPGNIAKAWNVKKSGSTVAVIDNSTDYQVNPEHALDLTMGDFKDQHVIYVYADLLPLYYEATFSCGDTGATFPDGSTEHSLWIPVGTGAESIKDLVNEAFGTPVKENSNFISWDPNLAMAAEATTFTPVIHGDAVRIYYVYEELGGEPLDYGKLISNGYVNCKTEATYCGEDGSELAENAYTLVASYNWEAYSLLMGWELLPDYTYTDENGNETKFVGQLGEGDIVEGNMVYVAYYKPFEDCWLIMYDTNTSYLIGSILEGIIDKERAINELFSSGEEELEPGKIESLVGDYTGLTLEQILSERLQKTNNKNIYKTVGKDFKTTYWNEGEQVSRKDAKVNKSEEDIVIWYQFKLINFNIKKIFSAEMWKHVYIAARPVTIPKSMLNPAETANTIKTIIGVIQGFMGN